MNSQFSDELPTWAKVGLGVLCLVLGWYVLKYSIWGISLICGWLAGIIVGAFRGAFELGLSSIVSTAWLSLAVQIVGIMVGSVVTLNITYQLTFVTVQSAAKQWVQFKKEHPEALRTVKKQTPPLIYSVGLLAQMFAMFATGIMPDDTISEKVHLLSFGALLLIPGWASNILLESESLYKRIMGWLFWLMCILAVPGVVWVVAKGDISKAWSILSTHHEILIFSVLIVLLAVITPRLVKPDDAE